MTARQSRTERRATERKARKLARKASGALPPPGTLTGFAADIQPAQELHRAPGFVSQAAPEAQKVHPSQSVANSRAEINRANAQHSTGPRTSEGKLASSRNSLKHGLASAQIIIPDEDPAAFAELLAALLDEHQPANPTEEILVQEMAQSHWLTQRAIRYQNQCFTPEGVDEKRLALFLRYQTTHDRAFHKALNTLIRLKKDRAVGFVSQHESRRKNTPGFVSQTAETKPAANQFVWQTAAGSGFVSQNPHGAK